LYGDFSPACAEGGISAAYSSLGGLELQAGQVCFALLRSNDQFPALQYGLTACVPTWNLSATDRAILCG
jgi:hypothetical protein